MVTADPTTVATAASGLVILLAGTMAFLGFRSYQHTGNVRLLFVVVAFIAFIIKSSFVAYNVRSHAVPHDSIELVSALFDLIIVLLLFVPFVTPPTR